MAFLKNILAKVVLVCIGILAGLLLSEVVLHIIPEKQIARIFYGYAFIYEGFQSNEEIGWVHIPGASFRWNSTGEYDVEVTYNWQGLRDREHTYQKPADTFRILALGDSMTEGIQVPMEETFASVLDTCLNKRMQRRVEVLNGGVSSYDSGNELLFYIHEGRKYRPDLVLVFTFLANDFMDLERDEDYDYVVGALGSYRFYLEDGRLRKQWISWSNPSYEVSPIEIFLRQNSRIYQILNIRDSKVHRTWKKVVSEAGELIQKLRPPAKEEKKGEQEKPLPPWYIYMYAEDFPDTPAAPDKSRQMWTLFEAIFRELKAQTMADGARLAVVLIPAKYEAQDKNTEETVQRYTHSWDMFGQKIKWNATAPFRAMTKLLTENGIPSLDLQPTFHAYNAASGRSLFYEKDSHINAEGHDLVAKSLCDWLVKEGLVY
jgi:lysophospholipase L1-like esterase